MEPAMEPAMKPAILLSAQLTHLVDFDQGY
jgi:hypothetical protein